jgi:hypothetical protein
MRLNSKISWTGGVLLLALGGFWLIGTLFPDQVFSAYQKAGRLVAAVGPIERLPSPVPIRRDAILPSHEDPLWKPFVVLPVSAAAERVSGRGWDPTEADIGGLELSLPLVPQLSAENWLPYYDLRIDRPERYFRQYFPVVKKGKKLIYVNSFRDESPNWRQHIVVIMDGATCCWQAFYDPAVHAFLTLTINGRA